MDSFFSDAWSINRDRENNIKKSLISRLSDNAREIQFEYANGNCGEFNVFFVKKVYRVNPFLCLSRNSAAYGKYRFSMYDN